MELGRVDPATVRLFAAGDLLAVSLFVVAGEYQHNVDPVANPGLAAGTLVPFLVGWAVAAPLLGAYGPRVRDSAAALAAPTVAAWLAADVLAQALRATAAFRGNADPVFFLVAAVAGGTFLLGWRGAATVGARALAGRG